MDKQDQNRDNQVQNRAAGTEQGQLEKTGTSRYKTGKDMQKALKHSW